MLEDVNGSFEISSDGIDHHQAQAESVASFGSLCYFKRVLQGTAKGRCNEADSYRHVHASLYSSGQP